MNISDPRWSVLLGGGIQEGGPVPGKFGVFLSSAGSAVSSAMVMTGAVVSGPGSEQNVYRRGSAVETVIRQDGIVNVRSRGLAVSARVESGQLEISGGGCAESASMSNGYLTVSNGGTLRSADITGGKLYGEPGGILSGVRFRNGIASITNASVFDMDISGGAVSLTNIQTASGITVSGGSMVISSGNVISGLTLRYAPDHNDSDGNPVYSSGVSARKAALSGLTVNGGRIIMSNCDLSSASLQGGHLYFYGERGYQYSSGIISGGLTVSTGSAFLVNAFADRISALAKEAEGGFFAGTIFVSGGKTGSAWTGHYGIVDLYSGAVLSSADGYGVISAHPGCSCLNISGNGGALHAISSFVSGLRMSGAYITTYDCSASDIVMDGGYLRGNASDVVLLNGAAFEAYTASGVSALSGTLVRAGFDECRTVVVESGASAVAYGWDDVNALTSGSGIMFDPVFSSGAVGSVYSHGIMSSPVIRSGAALYVSDHGSAVDVVLESGGSIYVDSGSTVTYHQS